jgi:hypothetical protein
MYTYDDLAQLARTCAKNAHIANSKEVAAKLWALATEYRDEATKLDGERGPYIGEPPSRLTD